MKKIQFKAIMKLIGKKKQKINNEINEFENCEIQEENI